MKTSAILVTGGLGYIGSHTAVALLERGFEVVIVDNLCNAEEGVLERIVKITGKTPAFFQRDVRDSTTYDDVLTAHPNIQAVVHFAALKAVGESVEKPLAYFDNNVVGLLRLLEAMVSYAVPNLIFSSSATVYGAADSFPILESHPVKPALSPYGNTKQVGESMIRDAIRSCAKLKAVSLRYFNPVGAHSSAQLGELPTGRPNNLMPFITQTAAGLRSELLVFGNDYDTPDGTAIRDYIHVEDLAIAHVSAVERMLEEKMKEAYEVFNLGTGQGYSVLEVIGSFERMSGQKLPYRIVDRRSGDVEKMYASTSKANQELGWQAERSLDDMTVSAWIWEKHLRKNNNVK